VGASTQDTRLIHSRKYTTSRAGLSRLGLVTCYQYKYNVRVQQCSVCISVFSGSFSRSAKLDWNVYATPTTILLQLRTRAPTPASASGSISVEAIWIRDTIQDGPYLRTARRVRSYLSTSAISPLLMEWLALMGCGVRTNERGVWSPQSRLNNSMRSEDGRGEGYSASVTV
jgi:hypothetical protein